MPYEKLSICQVMEKVTKEGLRLPLENISDVTIQRILNSCWEENPKDRAKIEHIHEQLSNILQGIEPSPGLDLSDVDYSIREIQQEWIEC